MSLLPSEVECQYAQEARECGWRLNGHNFEEHVCRRCADTEAPLCKDCGLCRGCIERLEKINPREAALYQEAMKNA